MAALSKADGRAPQRGIEQILREQALLLDQVRDAIVIHRPDGSISYWNQGCERIFGYTGAQALGQTFASLMGGGAALPAAAMASLLETGACACELTCMTANGAILTVEHRSSLMRDDDGAPLSILATHTDITERRRAEKEIVLLNNVLGQRIQKRTAELEQRSDDLRGFSHSLAHDLLGPLSSIGGFSARLESRLAGTLDDTCQHYLSRVRAGVRQMFGLTDALLELAELSDTGMERQSVDLSSVARSTLAQLRQHEPRSDAVEVEIAATLPAQGDAQLLAVVMEKLLGNAWKFTSKTPRARISFSGRPWTNGSYLYHVKDNGAGFDPGQATRLFGPFQRLHTSGEFEGTGIGLAIVRKIVMRHGGQVWAEARPDQGASFYFTLDEGAAPVLPGR